MNKLTKEQLKELNDLRETALESIQNLIDRMQELQDDAQDCFDNRSEQWQESEKADIYNDWIYDIEAKNDDIISIKDELEEVDFEEIERPEY